MKKSKCIIGSFLAAGILLGSLTFNSEGFNANARETGVPRVLQCQIDIIDYFLGLSDDEFADLMTGVDYVSFNIELQLICLYKA